MSVKDEFPQSSRSKEDEHFRKKDVEWVKKMRHESELDVDRTLMANTIGEPCACSSSTSSPVNDAGAAKKSASPSSIV